jgi:hypothetical protein
LNQAKLKLVPAAVLINGKLVRLEQLSQADAEASTSRGVDQWEAGEAGAAVARKLRKLVPAEVSITGSW